MSAKLTKLTAAQDGILRDGIFRTISLPTAEAANRFMEENRDWGMITERNGEVLLAQLSDKGDAK